MLWTMVVTKSTKRKRKQPDWAADDSLVFDLTEDEDESDEVSVSVYNSNEGVRKSFPNEDRRALSDDEDERKLQSFCSAKGSPLVKYTRKSRVHGQLPTITELANELKRVPSQIVLPLHSIQPAVHVNRLYLKFSAEAVEVRGGDNEESLVHEWPLGNIVGIAVHYMSDWEEDERALLSVRVSVSLSSLPGCSKRIDEYELELLNFRGSVADIFKLSPVYGGIVEELRKEDMDNAARTIEVPNSPTLSSLLTSNSLEESVQKNSCTFELRNTKECASLFTSNSEEEDVERTVCTSEIPNPNACTSVSISNSEEFEKAIATFEGLVYPQADPDAVTITQKDLKILKPFEFLNDTIIDFYIKYLQETIVSTEKLKTLHFFNSFFFSKLAEADACGLAAFERVKKWTRKVNVFEKDFVFIPVNQSLHWSLIIICHPGHMWDVPKINGSCDGDACILHLDSMEGCHRGVERHIKNYLLQEWLERNKDPDDKAFAERFFSGMPFRYSKVPQQDNSCDCGLFLLHYVELFLKTAPSIYRMKRQSSPPTQFLRRNWFKPSEASVKRLVIQNLILELSQRRCLETCRDHSEDKENANGVVPADEENSSPSTTELDRVRNDSTHLLEPWTVNSFSSRLAEVELNDDSCRAASPDVQENHASVQRADVSIEEIDDTCRDLRNIGSDQSKFSNESGTDHSSAHILVVDDIKSGSMTVSLHDDETWNFEKYPVPKLPVQVKPLQVPSLLDERGSLYRQPSAVVDLGTLNGPEVNDPSCSLSNRADRVSEKLLDFESILSPEDDDTLFESSYSSAQQTRGASNFQPVEQLCSTSVRSLESLYPLPDGKFKEDGRIDDGGRRPLRFKTKSSPLGRCSEISMQGARSPQRKPTEDRVLTQKDSNQPYGFTVCRQEIPEIQDLSSDDSSDSPKIRDLKKKTPELNVKRSSTETGKRVTRSITQNTRGLTLSAEKQTKMNALEDLLKRKNSRRR